MWNNYSPPVLGILLLVTVLCALFLDEGAVTPAAVPAAGSAH